MADFADAFAAFLKDGPTDSDGENNRSDHILFFFIYKGTVQAIHTVILTNKEKKKKRGEKGRKVKKENCIYIYLFI